ncbi:MAG: hypothetical protein Q4C71_05215 [Microbacteriaceae bacterium]|nr:hypothetical protein [Microbacteriaceae bacterium]
MNINTISDKKPATRREKLQGLIRKNPWHFFWPTLFGLYVVGSWLFKFFVETSVITKVWHISGAGLFGIFTYVLILLSYGLHRDWSNKRIGFGIALGALTILTAVLCIIFFKVL